MYRLLSEGSQEQAESCDRGAIRVVFRLRRGLPWSGSLGKCETCCRGSTISNDEKTSESLYWTGLTSIELLRRADPLIQCVTLLSYVLVDTRRRSQAGTSSTPDASDCD